MPFLTIVSCSVAWVCIPADILHHRQTHTGMTHSIVRTLQGRRLYGTYLSDSHVGHGQLGSLAQYLLLASEDNRTRLMVGECQRYRSERRRNVLIRTRQAIVAYELPSRHARERVVMRDLQ